VAAAPRVRTRRGMGTITARGARLQATGEPRHRPQRPTLPPRSLRLLGSAARNELRDDSDIDLLVEFEPGRTRGLLGIAELELALQELLGRDVDLRTPAT
jgi:hypothetical protein